MFNDCQLVAFHQNYLLFVSNLDEGEERLGNRALSIIVLFDVGKLLLSPSKTEEEKCTKDEGDFSSVHN